MTPSTRTSGKVWGRTWNTRSVTPLPESEVRHGDSLDPVRERARAEQGLSPPLPESEGRHGDSLDPDRDGAKAEQGLSPPLRGNKGRHGDSLGPGRNVAKS